MSSIEQNGIRNRLLAAVSPEIFAQLQPSLRQVEVPLRATLQAAGEPIEAVFFPETGYASMLAMMEDGDGAEVGLIGPEGVVGVPLILGSDRSPIEAIVQSAGVMLRLEPDVFRRTMDGSAEFRTLMLRFAMAFNVQVTMTAACNGRHLVEQRLSRWLLMAHERCVGDEFAMTHEFLSMMLGIRRAGVTVAAGMLQKAGLIFYEQGRIRIIDRPGLEAAACECYSVVSREYRRLLKADAVQGPTPN